MSEMSTMEPGPLRCGAANDVQQVRVAFAKDDGRVFGRYWRSGRRLESRSITLGLQLVIRGHSAVSFAEGYQGATGFGPRRVAIEESIPWLR